MCGTITIYMLTHYTSLIQKEGSAFWLRVLFVSPLLTQVLHHIEVILLCCIVQWCPATCTPGVLVCSLFVHVLYHSEVTTVCYCSRAVMPYAFLFLSMSTGVLSTVAFTMPSSPDLHASIKLST